MIASRILLVSNALGVLLAGVFLGVLIPWRQDGILAEMLPGDIFSALLAAAALTAAVSSLGIVAAHSQKWSALVCYLSCLFLVLGVQVVGLVIFNDFEATSRHAANFGLNRSHFRSRFEQSLTEAAQHALELGDCKLPLDDMTLVCNASRFDWLENAANIVLTSPDTIVSCQLDSVGGDLRPSSPQLLCVCRIGLLSKLEENSHILLGLIALIVGFQLLLSVCATVLLCCKTSEVDENIRTVTATEDRGEACSSASPGAEWERDLYKPTRRREGKQPLLIVFFLNFCNIVFALVGLVILSLGIYVKVSHEWQFLEAATTGSNGSGAGLGISLSLVDLSIIIGTWILLSAMIGLVGVARRSKWLLTTYLLLAAVLLALQLTAVIFVIRVSSAANILSDEIGSVVEQAPLGILEIAVLQSLREMVGSIYTEGQCKLHNDGMQCTNAEYLEAIVNSTLAVNSNALNDCRTALASDGDGDDPSIDVVFCVCQEFLVSKVALHASIYAGLVASVLALQLLLVFSALYLICCTRPSHKPDHSVLPTIAVAPPLEPLDTRRSLDPVGRALRLLLTLSNSLLLLVGLATLGLGTYLCTVAWGHFVTSVQSGAEPVPVFVPLLVLGGIMSLAAVLGLLGIHYSNRQMLQAYSLMLVLFFLPCALCLQLLAAKQLWRFSAGFETDVPGTDAAVEYIGGFDAAFSKIYHDGLCRTKIVNITVDVLTYQGSIHCFNSKFSWFERFVNRVAAVGDLSGECSAFLPDINTNEGQNEFTSNAAGALLALCFSKVSLETMLSQHADQLASSSMALGVVLELMLLSVLLILCYYGLTPTRSATAGKHHRESDMENMGIGSKHRSSGHIDTLRLQDLSSLPEFQARMSREERMTEEFKSGNWYNAMFEDELSNFRPDTLKNVEALEGKAGSDNEDAWYKAQFAAEIDPVAEII